METWLFIHDGAYLIFVLIALVGIYLCSKVQLEKDLENKIEKEKKRRRLTCPRPGGLSAQPAPPACFPPPCGPGKCQLFSPHSALIPRPQRARKRPICGQAAQPRADPPLPLLSLTDNQGPHVSVFLSSSSSHLRTRLGRETLHHQTNPWETRMSCQIG